MVVSFVSHLLQTYSQFFLLSHNLVKLAAMPDFARVYSLHHRKERNQRVFEGVPVLASQVFAFIEQELGIKACEDVRNRVYLNLYV